MGNDVTQDEDISTIEATNASLYGESDIIQEEKSIIRVKVQQKKGTKKVTIIENIPKELREGLLSSLKKEMGCGGILLDDKSSIQLQGDKTNMGIVSYLKKYVKDCKVELNGRVR
ncbi:translation initiation factor SUI1 [Encephalitozoon hellem]|uniref:Eukaryotic translation initiation factor 1 n=1 Tax=Encephalitozoon hellem TaxID=27973 RepID=A0A9Q9FAJ8_ENCHE|nr:uncharacterized protein EHEL_111540 [Encephalitozoon hellem ATCC 50504]AFM99427.1 hypothetical protein EHEL_111540 [Encephalitozoon hellem ATCC 50504]KAG5859073.1 translation initiation factor SUI1 [Encephalitozoon hellem]UTX44436.1 eukaryotic translation initiation factor 1 [Encephalitozoon hellem]WEL39937.1 eukaryotic translation initiation factor 1 [Encephalitozoon hellem]|eukprot:XP_003888408.1 hypothetical protein EHEL_111540 [Encephalitozoon hellem ATCC 50504]